MTEVARHCPQCAASHTGERWCAMRFGTSPVRSLQVGNALSVPGRLFATTGPALTAADCAA